MAQQGGRRKQAPAYSADTMALRYIAGLALAALGVMIFMAVDLNMSGNIFQGLRQVSFGTCGSLAYVLAVLPLWAGGLVIWSTQRRAPVRPWIFAVLSFAGICAFIMLIPSSFMQSMAAFTSQNIGAGKSTRALKALRYGISASLAAGAVIGIFTFFRGDLLCGIFSNDPAVILADEATGNLDTHTSFEMLVLFQKLHAEGRTIIFVPHNPDIALYSSRNIMLRDGKIREDTQNNNILSAKEALDKLPVNQDD